MIIQGKRDFVLNDPKPSFAQWFVIVDISEWLGSTETIQSVTYTARCVENGDDVSSTVLDATKNTYDNTNGHVKPFIQGGTPGYSYLVEMQVTTDQGSRDVWTLRFSVPPSFVFPNMVSTSLDAILYS